MSRGTCGDLGSEGFHHHSRSIFLKTLRRLFDVLCAAFGLLLLSPLLAFIALAIKIGDGGRVLYSQPRVGRDFRLFRLLKFRTMVPLADRFGSLTSAGDRRVTPLGRILRRYKLDELPQLMNVLKGDMQLVGARPELERYVAMFRDHYALILRERPGVTDPATLTYRREEEVLEPGRIEEQYVSEILPRKLELSSEYLAHRTFISDLGLIVRTLLHIPIQPNPGAAPAHAGGEPGSEADALPPNFIGPSRWPRKHKTQTRSCSPKV